MKCYVDLLFAVHSSSYIQSKKKSLVYLYSLCLVQLNQFFRSLRNFEKPFFRFQCIIAIRESTHNRFIYVY